MMRLFNAKKILILSILVLCYTSGILAQNQKVSMISGKFVKDGSFWFPKIINYPISIVNSGNQYWVSPNSDYGGTKIFECTDSASCSDQIRADLQLMKDLNFDAVRVCQFQIYERNSSGFLHQRVYETNWGAGGGDFYPRMPRSGYNYSDHFKLIESFLDIAENLDLKVILLTGIANEDTINEKGIPITIADVYTSYLGEMANYFKDNTTLMAYDLCNEPLWDAPFAESNWSSDSQKPDACNYVTQWVNAIEAHTNHLTTIGYWDPDEVFGFDPSIMPVSFASFHPYPDTYGFDGFDLSKVENDIYWMYDNLSIPWIIGECGWSNLDTTAEDEQVILAKESLERTRDCNGQGYSWWQFQDGNVWQDMSNYVHSNAQCFGVLHDLGQSVNSVGDIIAGDTKPFVQEITNFDPYAPQGECNCLPNYYNLKGYWESVCTGRILSTTGEPIKGALVYGKSFIKDGDDTLHLKSYRTYSDANGVFNIHSLHRINSGIMVGALGKEGVYGHSVSEGTPIIQNGGGVPIGNIITKQTNNNIEVSNYVVDGNGTSGGTLKLVYGGAKTALKPGFRVKKGGNLKVYSQRIAGDIVMNDFECSPPPAKKDSNKTSLMSNSNEEKYLLSEITIHPNPTNGKVFMSFTKPEEIERVSIKDQFGKTILSNDDIKSQITLNLCNYPRGLYFAYIFTKFNTEVRKIVLN